MTNEIKELEDKIFRNETDIKVIKRTIELLKQQIKSLEWSIENDDAYLCDLRDGKIGEWHK